MARYECARCHESSNTLSPPHLCKDIARRHARFQNQVTAVREIIDRRYPDDGDTAVKIVEKLNRMGVGNEA